MTNCAKCGCILTSSNRARGHRGVVQWCMYCPPSETHLWNRDVVGSGTGYTGGKVGVGQEDDDIDVRDLDEVEGWGGAVSTDPGALADPQPRVQLRRDRVTAGPLKGVDLVHYMRTGQIRPL